MDIVTVQLFQALKELTYMEMCLYLEFAAYRTRVDTNQFWNAFDNWIV